jgi:hypothetical protein
VLMGCVVGVLVHTHHPAATCWPLTAGTWTAP